MTSTGTDALGTDSTGAAHARLLSDTITPVDVTRPRANQLTHDQRRAVLQRLLHLAELEEHREERIESLDPELVAAHDTGVLDAVRDALGKLATGTYGTCEACHCDIPFGRIEAMPYARRCVTCQQHTDHGWVPARSSGGHDKRPANGDVPVRAQRHA